MSTVFRKFFLSLVFFGLSTFFLATPVLGEQALLSWSPNTESDLAGYVLYYKDDSSNLPLTKTEYTERIPLTADQTIYTKTGLGNGVHRFALTAFDTSFNESALSIVVQKTISSATPSDPLSPEIAAQEGNAQQGGGGGCGLVFPISGNDSGDPPGPGDAAGMVTLASAIFILFIKKALQPPPHLFRTF